MKKLSTRFAWLMIAAALGGTAPAVAQEIQERTIRFGHLNNPDHPVSIGVKKFAELVAAKSGARAICRAANRRSCKSSMAVRTGCAVV